MFGWNKKIEEPQPTHQEVEIVDSVLFSMRTRPDSWTANSTCGGKPRFTRVENSISVEKVRVVNLTEVCLTYGSVKLTFNNAEVNLTEISRRKLIAEGDVLLREKLLRSMARADEQDEKNESTS